MLDHLPLWRSDLDAVLSQTPALRDLGGASILVTGATGLVGSALVSLLLRFNEGASSPVDILCAGRSEARLRGRFPEASGLRFVPFDAAAPSASIDASADLVVHAAGNSAPAAIAAQPVETLLMGVSGTRALLDALAARGGRRLLFVSSSEVYGRLALDRPWREEDAGAHELLDPRSAYALGKMAGETLCISYAAEYGLEAVIARPGHLYGPTATPADNHVAAAFLRAAARGEPLTLKSAGSQLRSWVHCLDCAGALITLLAKGRPGAAYNVAHPDSAGTIRELAECISRQAGVPLRSEAPTLAERNAFNPMDNSALDPSRLQALGWRPEFDLETGVAHALAAMKEETTWAD